MFLINLNAEIVAYILSLRKSRHKPNLENTSKYGFSPDLGGKKGGVLSMRMQVILDSSFARPGSAPIWGGKKGEFRDWTSQVDEFRNPMKNELKTQPCLKPVFEIISNTDANFLNLHIDKATKTRGDKQLFNHTFYETNFKPKFTANVIT